MKVKQTIHPDGISQLMTNKKDSNKLDIYPPMTMKPITEKKKPIETFKALKLINQAIENDVEISEEEIANGLMSALERDFGKLDKLPKLTWWDKLIINIKYLLNL